MEVYYRCIDNSGGAGGFTIGRIYIYHLMVIILTNGLVLEMILED